MQDAPHRGDEFALCYVFEDITSGTCFERLEEVLGIFMDRDENHAGTWALLLDAAAGGQAIHLRHAYVDQGEIGLQAMAERQRLAAICRLAYQLQSPLTGEHGTQTGPGKLMVISDYQPRWSSPLPWWRIIAHETCSSPQIAAAPRLVPGCPHRCGWKPLDAHR